MSKGLLEHLTLLATRAPSIHNTQPWRIVPTDDGLDVRVDVDRQLTVLDPLGRQMLMSCGALVHHVVVAATALALDADVSLLPTPGVVAHVRLRPAGRGPTDEELRRAEAITRRATDRTRFLGGRMADETFERMRHVVEAQGAVLVRVRDDGRVAVEVLVSAADRELMADEKYLHELQEWVFDPEVDGPRDDGIPFAALDPGAGRAEEAPGRRFLPGEEPQPGPAPQAAERPDFLLLATLGDEPLDWVRAGMALSALLLDATELHLSAQPLGQVTDLAAERMRLRTELSVVGVPQLLLRVGLAAARPVLRTPRRVADNVLGARA